MFTVEIKDQAVVAALARAAAQMDDMSKLTHSLSEILLDSTKERFKKSEAPDGSKWAAKSPVTRQRYPREVRPLFGESRDLYDTIFPESGPDFAAVVSPMSKAAMLHFGGTKEQFPHLWGDIPARPFLGISQEDSDHIAGQIADHLSRAFE
jgi:phage virion morphogenesis protein